MTILQCIVLRGDYGIHVATKRNSHDKAFSLASILLTSDFIWQAPCLDEFSACFE